MTSTMLKRVFKSNIVLWFAALVVVSSIGVALWRLRSRGVELFWTISAQDDSLGIAATLRVRVAEPCERLVLSFPRPLDGSQVRIVSSYNCEAFLGKRNKSTDVHSVVVDGLNAAGAEASICYSVRFPEALGELFDGEDKKYCAAPLLSVLLVPGDDYPTNKAILRFTSSPELSLIPKDGWDQEITSNFRNYMLVLGACPPVRLQVGGVRIRCGTVLDKDVHNRICSWFSRVERLLAVNDTSFDVFIVMEPDEELPKLDVLSDAARVAVAGFGSILEYDLSMAAESIALAQVAPTDHSRSWWLARGVAKLVAIETLPESLARLEWRRIADNVIMAESDLSREATPSVGLCAAYTKRLSDASGISLPFLALALSSVIGRSTDRLEWEGALASLLPSFQVGTDAVEAFEMGLRSRLLSREAQHYLMSSRDCRTLSDLHSAWSDNGDTETSLTFALSRGSEGRLENCGCKGNEDGGLSRRATVIREVQSKRRRLVAFDLGDWALHSSTDVIGEVEKLELGAQVDILGAVGYSALALADMELRLPPAVLRSLTKQARMPLLTSVKPVAGRTSALTGSMIETDAGLIGVVGLSEPATWSSTYTFWSRVQRQSWKLEEDSIDLYGIKAASSALRDQGAVAIVGVGALGPTSALQLIYKSDLDLLLLKTRAPAYSLEGIAWICKELGLHSDAEPRGRPWSILWTPPWESGGYVRFADIRLSPEQGLTVLASQARRLSIDIVEDAEVRAMLDGLYYRLNEVEAGKYGDSPFEGWSIETLSGNRYAGESACRKCHAQEWASWKVTHHADAMKTLEERHRSGLRKCVKCHSTGFERDGGFSLGKNLELAGVQCETCHGPGALHVSNPGRKGVIRREVSKDACEECHTEDRSESFDRRYDEMRHQVRHQYKRVHSGL